MNEQEKIQIVKEDLNQIEGWIKPIDSEESLKNAADNLKGIKNKIKDIDELKKTVTKPINEALKAYRAMFAPLEDKAEAIKSTLTKYILEYQREQIRLHQEAERIAREAEAKRIEDLALQSGDEETVDQAIEIIDKIETAKSEVITGVKSDWSKTIIKDKWVYEVENPNLVPKHLLSPDHAKIMAEIKSGVHSIPGLKITNKGSLTSLSR